MVITLEGTVNERVIDAYNELKKQGRVKNKTAFAKAGDFLPTYWAGYEQGSRKVSIQVLSNLAKQFGLNFTWLAEGKESMFSPDKHGPAPFDAYAIGPLTDQPYVDLPFPDFKTLAHFGQHPDLSLRSFISSPTLRIYLEPGELPEKYDGAMVIEVWGDSMEPNLYSGDRMIVWQIPEAKWESLHNVDCVVSYDDTVTIKAIAENDLFVYDRLTLRAANPPSSYFVVSRQSIHSIWEVREYYKRPKYSPSSRRR